MVRLAGFVLRHKLLVVLFWVAMFGVGVYASSQTTERLVVDFSLPGQPGYETETQLLETLRQRRVQPADHRRRHRARGAPRWSRSSTRSPPVFDELEKALPGTRTVDFADTQDPKFITEDGRTTFLLVYPEPFESFTDVGPTSRCAPSSSRRARTPASTSGSPATTCWPQGTEDPEAPSVLVETLIGAARRAGSCCSFVFASFLAFVPLLIAAVSILTTFLVVLLVTYVTDVSFVVQFLIALVGLGVAIDYSLLVVTRWREERAHGRDNDEAVVDRDAVPPGTRWSPPGSPWRSACCALVVIPVPAAAQHGHRRHAHPAGQHRGRAHPAAGAAGQIGPAGRLAADPARGQAVPGLDARGPRSSCGTAGSPPASRSSRSAR